MIKTTTSATILLIVITIILFSFCSEELPSEPENTLNEEIQEALDKGLERHGVMGASVAVIIPGEKNVLVTSELSNTNTPITADMIFSLASVTKTLTAALILQLREEDKLTLEDPLDKWLPSFPNIDSTITIRQLLNHTSGIYDFSWNPEALDYLIIPELWKIWTPEEVLNSFVLEPNFAPGAGWSYSNTNYVILGMIIEAATGSQVSTELRNRFFEPLGLNSMFLAVEETIIGDMATSWEDINEDGIPEDCSIYQAVAWSATWTCGAIVSTAEDMAKWSQALFRGDILSQATMLEMLTFHPVYRYGLGVSRYSSDLFQGVEAIGHDGGNI